MPAASVPMKFPWTTGEVEPPEDTPTPPFAEITLPAPGALPDGEALRDVLLGTDTVSVKAAIDRLQTIGSLMEKESRVASWGVRTVTGPLLAGAGVVLFMLFGSLTSTLGESGVTALRYFLVSLLGAVFLYYGLKAVQLTEMSNRVWKRTAEYNLILTERKRLGL